MNLKKRLISTLLAVAMVLGMVSTATATSNAVTLKIPADGTTNTYWTLSDAINAIPNGKDAEIMINESLNETSVVTIAPTTASSIKIDAVSGTTIKTPLIVSGSSKVTIGQATFDTSGVAVTVNSPATLTLANGSVVKGTTTGVRNQGGTVNFSPGHKVSDYTHISGTVNGSWSVITTATPVPTGTTAAIAVTGISGVPTTLSMRINEIQKLNPVVAPTNATNKTLTYASNNTAVVTVSSEGYVTAKTAGTALITVRSADGNVVSPCLITVSNSSATASPSPSPTATASPSKVDAPVYVARNALLYLDNKKISGNTTKSSIRVTRRPLSYKVASVNKISIPVVAFQYLDEQDFDSVRYDLPWVKVDIYPEAVDDMKKDARLTVGVQRITPSGTMQTQWNKIKSKNVSGPWSITSNSDEEGYVYRFALPELITKSKLRLVKWNGKEFKDVTLSKWTVIKLNSTYYVRTDALGDGVYAVVKK